MLEDSKLVETDNAKPEERSWRSELRVGGVSYASSLFWQPLQNSENPFNEVEEAASVLLEGADLFCIKPGKSQQFGICVSKEGFKAGENVAAVALSSAYSNIGSFVAVFKVDNGWWYVCIRNDIILSDGDMLFVKEEDAKNQFMAMLTVPDWGKKIAPAEWGIEDTEEVDVAEILQRGAKIKLQKIKALRGTKLMIVVLAGIVIGVWALSNLIDYMLTPAKRPVIAPVAPKVVRKIEQTPQAEPWEKLVSPAFFMGNCYNKMMSLVKILPPGWTIGNLTCSFGGVSTFWKRDVGRISIIEKALNDSDVKFLSKTFSDDGKSVLVTLSLGPREILTSPPTRSDADMKLLINDLFQSIGQSVSLSSKTEVVGKASSSAAKGKGSMTVRTTPKTYKKLHFRFSSVHNPMVWRDLLMKFSGLEINSIIYSPAKGVWEYEGDIYVL